MGIAQDYQQVLEDLWTLACHTCDEIEAFRPDLVLVLYHGAKPCWLATSTLWQATRVTPLPPVLATNLGREKGGYYDEARQRIGICQYIDWAMGPRERGHVLAWAALQRDWQTILQERITAVLGADVKPRRVLVLDDFSYEGITWVLALGLLQTAYPSIESRFVSGWLSGWKRTMPHVWLARHHPEVLAQIKTDWKQNTEHRTCFAGYQSLWSWVASGTESANSDSFDWRPITVESFARDYDEDERPSGPRFLRRFLPPEEWLRVPIWIDHQVEDYLRQQLASQRPTAAEKPGRIEHKSLQPADFLFQRLWSGERVTSRQVAAACRNAPDPRKYILPWIRRRGRGRAACYTMRPEDAAEQSILTAGRIPWGAEDETDSLR